MTAAQLKNRERFKKAIAEAKKLRKKNPKLSQAQAVKQAWSILYSSAKVSGVKKKAAKKAAVNKKAAVSKHKDTKSHNVNIKVVSGIKKVSGYEGTSRRGKKTWVHYTNNSLSGYKTQPEIIVGKIGDLSVLKQLAPEVKLRITRGKKVGTNQIKSALDAVLILKKFITPSKIQTQEFFCVMFLNNNNNVLAVYQIGMGAITSVSVDSRLMMAAALKLGATGLILCHNHPSGNLTPSQADKTFTEQVNKVSKFHSINLLDHVIITKESYYSFAENGIL